MAREEAVAIRAMKATLRADLKVMILGSEECGGLLCAPPMNTPSPESMAEVLS
jgi:hypothetical protein